MFYLLLSSILQKVCIFYGIINFRFTRVKCYWLICTYCSLLNVAVHTCTYYR